MVTLYIYIYICVFEYQRLRIVYQNRDIHCSRFALRKYVFHRNVSLRKNFTTRKTPVYRVTRQQVLSINRQTSIYPLAEPRFVSMIQKCNNNTIGECRNAESRSAAVSVRTRSVGK